jgi:hypothetical protein
LRELLLLGDVGSTGDNNTPLGLITPSFFSSLAADAPFDFFFADFFMSSFTYLAAIWGVRTFNCVVLIISCNYFWGDSPFLPLFFLVVSYLLAGDFDPFFLAPDFS